MGGPSRARCRDVVPWERVSDRERRVVLCRRLPGIGPNPSTKDAELIAFRVGEYHPRRVTLPDIDPPSIEGKQTFDFDRPDGSQDGVRLPAFSCGTGMNNRPATRSHQPRSTPATATLRCVPRGPSDRVPKFDSPITPRPWWKLGQTSSCISSGLA